MSESLNQTIEQDVEKVSSQENVKENDLEKIEEELDQKGKDIIEVVDRFEKRMQDNLDKVDIFFEYGSDTLYHQVESIKNGNINYSEIKTYSNFSTPKNLSEFIVQVEDQFNRAKSINDDLDKMINEISDIQTRYENSKRKAVGSGIDKQKIETKEYDSKYYTSISMLEEINNARNRSNTSVGSIKKGFIELKTIEIQNSMK